MTTDPREESPPDDPPVDELLRRPHSGTPPQPGGPHDDAVMRAMAATATRIRRRHRRRWQMPLALAATLVVGIGVVMNMQRAPDEDPLALRGGAAAAVAPPDQAQLDAAPGQLSWPAVAGATGYGLELRDERGELIWQDAALAHPWVELPADLRSRLDGGGTFLWAVSAQSPGGPVTVGSFWFEIRHTTPPR